MPKVNPRNKVGMIVHAILKIVPDIHIYGNVNYGKTFIQGTIMNVFDWHKPGGENAVWKLTVNFEMPYNETVEFKRVAVHRQHCPLGPVLARKNQECPINFTDWIGKPNHATKGSMTYLPNTKGRAPPNSMINAASAAPCVLLSPASDKIKVIPLPPALPIINAVPPAAARTKKKRKKAAAPAVPTAASDDAATATPTLSTAPATKKGKTTGKKKAAKPVDLCSTPMWAKTTDGASHCVVAIAHRQKWVASNAATINGDVTNSPCRVASNTRKGPSGERIAPGNPDFADISAIDAFLHVMPPEQLALMLELTNERLVAKGKMELTHQELL